MLTNAQLLQFKADLLANANLIPTADPARPWVGAFAGVAVKNVPASGDGNAAVAGWYNQLTAAWTVWRDLPMETVLNTITFANMTPADAVPASPDLAVQGWIARSLSCQGKQFNLQNLINGRASAPMKQANYRAALQDCLTNLPAGAAGALIAANWIGVRDAAKSLATNLEKLLSTGTGTLAAPADLGYEGAISGDDVQAARNST